VTDPEAERRFREDLEVREEVAPDDTDPLPPGVTHTTSADEDDDEGEEPHRRRFSAT
jgi:hypothetical protein